jgi:hypothetical protein
MTDLAVGLKQRKNGFVVDGSNHGIIRVRDLGYTPRERLEAMSVIGPSTLREIDSVLAELGVQDCV